jgi:hypothetical protein
MARVPKRLVGPFQPLIAANSASVCNPASGTKVVARYIKVANTDTAAHYLCVTVASGNVATAANRLIDQLQIPAGGGTTNGEYERWINWPVEAGEELCFAADTAAKLTVTVTGDLYTLG